MNSEPALIVGAASAIIDIAIGFGAPIDPAQKTLILAGVMAIVPLIGAVIIRQNVKPTK